MSKNETYSLAVLIKIPNDRFALLNIQSAEKYKIALLQFFILN